IIGTVAHTRRTEERFNLRLRLSGLGNALDTTEKRQEKWRMWLALGHGEGQALQTIGEGHHMLGASPPHRDLRCREGLGREEKGGLIGIGTVLRYREGQQMPRHVTHYDRSITYLGNSHA